MRLYKERDVLFIAAHNKKNLRKKSTDELNVLLFATDGRVITENEEINFLSFYSQIYQYKKAAATLLG